jgi:hypothetical protein
MYVEKRTIPEFVITLEGNMTEENFLKTLSKSQNDKWIGGVCGGLGAYTPLPSWLWRVIFRAGLAKLDSDISGEAAL